MIKYGSIEYFTLLELQDTLKSPKYSKLDLITLMKLRTEIAIKLGAIHDKHDKVDVDKLIIKPPLMIFEHKSTPEKQNHICRYSKAMNQPYPRLCTHCGKPEEVQKSENFEGGNNIGIEV